MKSIFKIIIGNLESVSLDFNSSKNLKLGKQLKIKLMDFLSLDWIKLIFLSNYLILIRSKGKFFW